MEAVNAVHRMEEHWGGVDIPANNAAALRGEMEDELSLEDWHISI